MNEVPPSEDLPDVDEHYRRAAALDPSRPSEALRRAVLSHAADLAAERATLRGTAHIDSTRRAPSRARRRHAIFGTLAAAALAGLLITPRFLTHHTSTTAVSPTAAISPPSQVSRPKAGANPPANAPTAASSPDTAGEKPSPPPAEARSMAESSPRSADASHPDAAAQGRAASRNAAAPMPRTPPADPAALRRAAEFGDIHGLQTLLDERVSIDARDAGGRTALMLAVLHGHAEAVDALLARGADPNAADAHGTTPLEAAVAGNQPAVAAALRRAGARAH